MKNVLTYRCGLSWFLLLLLGFCACTKPQKKTNWSINYSRESKEPYGTYLCYQAVQDLFPTEVQIIRPNSSLQNLSYKLEKHGGTALLLFIGNSFQPSNSGIDSLIAYAAAGHQVWVAANIFSHYFLHRLGVSNNGDFLFEGDTVTTVSLNIRGLATSYKHDNFNLDLQSFFKDIEGNPGHLVLGTTEQNKPNLLMYKIGKGHLWVHAAPTVFSNYFLLREGNQEYLERAMSLVPHSVNQVYWSDFQYFSPNQSDWSVLWAHPATRIALLLALMGLVVYIVFEMKRKQKIIPVIPPVENASVAFVETIGRLFYNKKDHSNLAEKMTQHFLDYVRQNFYLNTSTLDEDFIQQLSARSGQNQEQTRALVLRIKAVQDGLGSNEKELYSLYSQIRRFTHGRK